MKPPRPSAISGSNGPPALAAGDRLALRPVAQGSIVGSAELPPDGSPATVTTPGGLAPADGPVPVTPGQPRPHLSDELPHGRAGGFRDTQPMTVTGLMGLPAAADDHADAAADAWGIARTRG